MSPYHNNSLREDNALAVFGLLSVDFLHGEKPDVVTEQVSLLWWQKAFKFMHTDELGWITRGG